MSLFYIVYAFKCNMHVILDTYVIVIVSGFALGSTIESKTKGIWMWCVPHLYKEGHTLVLLDTEGLGDIRKVGEEDISSDVFIANASI